MVDLLWLRIGVTIATLIVAIVIFCWSKRLPSFFIGLYALAETVTRVGMQYFDWCRKCLAYEFAVTIASLSILIALLLLTNDIYSHRKDEL